MQTTDGGHEGLIEGEHMLITLDHRNNGDLFMHDEPRQGWVYQIYPPKLEVQVGLMIVDIISQIRDVVARIRFPADCVVSDVSS